MQDAATLYAVQKKNHHHPTCFFTNSL